MKVVYSDESGTGGNLNDEPVTVVAAILLNIDSHWPAVRDAVECAVKDTMGLSDLELSRYTIKGHRLYQKIERVDVRANELMGRLMLIPGKHVVPIWYGAVDRDGYHYQMENIHIRSEFNRRDAIAPFRIAFEDCIQRIDTYVHAFCEGEQVLWIHDEGKLNRHAKATLRNLRALLKELEEEHALGFPHLEKDHPARKLSSEITISHIADMIYFGKDEESRLLQLADVCCATIARALRNDPFALPFYDALGSRVQNRNTRPRYESARRTVLPIREMLAKKRRLASQLTRAKK